MKVGVPREIKSNEQRVALTPIGVRDLVASGNAVIIEQGAGSGSSVSDADYEAQGATIVSSATDVFAEADMILKVKEPQPTEVDLLHPGQILFTYLHLAAYPKMAVGLRRRGIVAIAYETVQLPDRSLPLLAPMSEIAGRMATQVGAYFLEAVQGGRGILLGGVPGVRPAKVVVVGAGMAGFNAAAIAAGMQAEVVVLDVDNAKLRRIDSLYAGRIITIASNTLNLEKQVLSADLVVGTVLVPGASTPKLVTAKMVTGMKRGAVMVDVAIDQGGCFETSHETTHEDPVFEVDGVLHYAVGNIPGAVAHTSTYALTNATLRYVLALANEGVVRSIKAYPELGHGINIVGDAVCHPAVASSLNVDAVTPGEALENW